MKYFLNFSLQFIITRFNLPPLCFQKSTIPHMMDKNTTAYHLKMELKQSKNSNQDLKTPEHPICPLTFIKFLWNSCWRCLHIPVYLMEFRLDSQATVWLLCSHSISNPRRRLRVSCWHYPPEVIWRLYTEPVKILLFAIIISPRTMPGLSNWTHPSLNFWVMNSKSISNEKQKKHQLELVILRQGA